MSYHDVEKILLDNIRNSEDVPGANFDGSLIVPRECGR